MQNSQLGLILCPLEHRLQFRSFRHITLDLELASHEQPLWLGLAFNEFAKVLVREGQGNCDNTLVCGRLIEHMREQVACARRLGSANGSRRRTISLYTFGSVSLCHDTVLFEVNMPAILITC